MVAEFLPHDPNDPKSSPIKIKKCKISRFGTVKYKFYNIYKTTTYINLAHSTISGKEKKW